MDFKAGFQNPLYQDAGSDDEEENGGNDPDVSLLLLSTHFSDLKRDTCTSVMNPRLWTIPPKEATWIFPPPNLNLLGATLTLPLLRLHTLSLAMKA